MMTSDNSKGKRARNFQDSEIQIFVRIFLPKYKDRIENKKSDSQTRDDKSGAWQELTQEFNSISSLCHRSEENLKHLWDRLKRDARKSKAGGKGETFQTGGGRRDDSKDPTSIDDCVLQVIGPSGTGLKNECDGDANAMDQKPVPEETLSNRDAATEPSNGAQADVDMKEEFEVNTKSNSTAQASKESSCKIKTEEKHPTWAESVPRMLYSKKSEALRVKSIHPNPTSETSKKSSIAGELEWAQRCKRRRPSIPQDENQIKLTAAKLQLTEATKKKLEEEGRRNEELFEIEKKKKEAEAELALLQVMKMKRELNLVE